MSKNSITNMHYDFVNNIVKLLGFDDLTDFQTILFYSDLKDNEELICERFNETVAEFKFSKS